MSRPSFQFYPADWRNNAKLRRCSEAARGVWIDIMCVFHDSDEYGVVHWPLIELARAAGASLKLVKELVGKGVLKGSDSGFEGYSRAPRHSGKEGDPVALVEPCDGPCWFSSRMVWDEWVRRTKGASSRFGGGNEMEKPPTKPLTMPRHGDRQGDKPSHGMVHGSSTSSSSSVAAATRDNPASASEADSSELLRLSRLLGFDETRFQAHAANLRTLIDLKNEGCDFEKHILPAAESAAKGKRARTLSYVVPKARELRDAQKTVEGLPAPFVDTTPAGWRDRYGVFREHGRWSSEWGPKPPDSRCPEPLRSELNAKYLVAAPTPAPPPPREMEIPACLIRIANGAPA